jgi:hypothetical protein
VIDPRPSRVGTAYRLLRGGEGQFSSPFVAKMDFKTAERLLGSQSWLI